MSKRALASLSFILATTSVVGGEEAPISLTVSHPLQIGRHSAVALTDGGADTIISGVSSILAQCTSNAHRQGPVTVVSTPGTINSNADLSAACGASALQQEGGYEPLGIPRRVRVVNAINWCSTIGTGIIGCAPTPGTCMVVVRYAADQEGELWAHEFGHSKGLPHRDEPNALMRPFIGPTHRSLTKAECSQIRQLGFFEVVAQGTPTSTIALSIVEFVTRSFPHGVPYDEARQFTSPDLDQVIPWLQQSDKARYWTNVASVVGIVADSRSSQVLRNHIQRPATGPLSPEDYQSRVSAIISLGYVVNGSGDAEARRFLEEKKVPSAWAGTTWRAPYHASDDERNNDLAIAAVLGLGLIGDAKAKIMLEDAKGAATRGTPDTSSLIGAVEQALKANSLISESGMRGYQRR